MTWHRISDGLPSEEIQREHKIEWWNTGIKEAITGEYYKNEISKWERVVTRKRKEICLSEFSHWRIAVAPESVTEEVGK